MRVGEESLTAGRIQRTSKPRPLRSPGVKGPGGTVSSGGNQSPVLDITGARVPLQVPRSLTFTQCLETGKHKVLHRVQMPTAFPVVTPRCLHLPSVTGLQRTVLNPPRGENLLTTPLAQFCRFPALTLLATYPEEWLLRCKSLGRNCPGGGGRCIRRKRET